MNVQAQQMLLAFLAICSPFLLSFLIVAILAPRYKDFAARHGWSVEPHPEDHRDYLFQGGEDGIQWEMEYYVFEHYRKLSGKYVPFMNVIVWSTNSMRLPNHTLLIFPRRDRLRHFVHPRLSLGINMDLVTNHETEKLERFLFRLPQIAIGAPEFQELFLVRTDLEHLPDNLIRRLQVELLEWPKIQMAGPVILMNRMGVTIWWIPIGMRNEWLEKTVHLGISVAGVL
jgi:hypothetical protein